MSSKRSRKRVALFEKTSQPKASTVEESDLSQLSYPSTSQSARRSGRLSQSQTDDKREEEKAVVIDDDVDDNPVTEKSPVKTVEKSEVHDEKQENDQVLDDASSTKSDLAGADLPGTQPMTDELSDPTNLPVKSSDLPTDEKTMQPKVDTSETSKDQTMDESADPPNEPSTNQTDNYSSRETNSESTNLSDNQPTETSESTSTEQQPDQQSDQYSDYIKPFLITAQRVQRCKLIDDAYVSKLTEVDTLIMQPLAQKARDYLDEKEKQQHDLKEQNTTLDAKLQEFIAFLHQMRTFVTPPRPR